MALKAGLVGFGDLPPLLARMKTALHARGFHQEDHGAWRLTFRETTIAATRISQMQSVSC